MRLVWSPTDAQVRLNVHTQRVSLKRPREAVAAGWLMTAVDRKHTQLGELSSECP